MIFNLENFVVQVDSRPGTGNYGLCINIYERTEGGILQSRHTSYINSILSFCGGFLIANGMMYTRKEAWLEKFHKEFKTKKIFKSFREFLATNLGRKDIPIYFFDTDPLGPLDPFKIPGQVTVLKQYTNPNSNNKVAIYEI